MTPGCKVLPVAALTSIETAAPRLKGLSIMKALFSCLPPALLLATLSLSGPLAAQEPATPMLAPQGRRAAAPFHVVYNLTLVGDGRRVEVSPSHVFHNGDQVALRLLSSRDAFVYVFNRTITGDPDEIAPRSLVLEDEIRQDGTAVLRGVRLLYPEPGQVARLRANVHTAIPARGKALTLADPVGVEKLYVVISPRPLDLSTLADATPTAEAVPPAPAPSNDSASDVDARLSRFIDIAGNTDNWISQNESRDILEVDASGNIVQTGQPVLPRKPPATAKPTASASQRTRIVPHHPACAGASCGSCPTCRRAAPKRPGEPILIDISLVHQGS